MATVAAPIDESPVVEPLGPAEKAKDEHEHIYDNFPKISSV